MQTETPNSTKPSSSSPAKPQRQFRRKPQARQPFRRPTNQGGGFRQEVSAGGIIFRRRQGNAEIFFIKDMFGKWTFPKGKPNPGEALPDTAIRECGEEVGLQDLRNPLPLGRTSFRFRRQGVVVQKTVHFFLLEAAPDAKEKFKSREEVPAGREHITEGKWVRTQTVFSISSYKNSDRLLARALRIIATRRSPQYPRPNFPQPRPPAPTSM